MAHIQFDNKTYPTYGELPNVGSSAPDIRLVNTELQNVSLANFTGMRKLLNIFVSIDTDVCAKSVLEFSRLAQGYDDIAMLMVSYDLLFAHKRFQEKHELGNVTLRAGVDTGR